MLIKRVIKKILRIVGFEIVRTKEHSKSPFALGYVSAKDTIEAALIAGISVPDYLENKWGCSDNRKAIIKKLENMGVFCKRNEYICEIGTGAGLYVDKVLELCNPKIYESYEPDQEWAIWLAKEYELISHKADGKELSYTNSASIDLVLSHGVFVYLPFLLTYGYFQEIARVTCKDAYVVFDILSEECFDDETLLLWLASGQLFPQFLCKQYVINFFRKNGFVFKGDFFNEKFNVDKSLYLVFQKTDRAQ